jgi:Carboxypeptidase regulatory-like domain/TonB-dependent Receptor Plug Domain
MQQDCGGSQFRKWLLLSCLGWLSAGLLMAQTATGGINGTITDQSGANIPGAVMTLTSASTGATRSLTASSTGTYAITSLEPGAYELHVSAAGFQSIAAQVRVLVGQIANGNFTLAPGHQVTEIEVGGATSDQQVNTTQPTVQDALTATQIDNTPLNGRNFLDLAQLTPGVQIQDGGNFDPTKNGFTGISLQGRSGRSTRIEVDGVDITDETVGTTTINISEDSIQEFQVAQSMLDPATSLTSSGSVNVITRSGTNGVHGSGFYLFRNDATAARVAPERAPFERDQVGFRLGGPFLKDRLFWFTNYEHTLQHGTVFTEPSAPFSNYSGAFSSPFHEYEATGRLDWNITQNWRAFYAFHHDQFNVVTGFGGNVLSPYSNRNLTDVHTVAFDGATGQFSHSFRYGYLTFRNFINDARSQVPNLPQPFPDGGDAAVAIGTDPRCISGTDLLCLGPTWLAPQTTLQRNQQFRYDGARLLHSHTLRYGVNYVRTPQYTFGSFGQLGPSLTSNGTATEVAFAQNGPFPGGASNPQNYPLEVLGLGNGLGYFSEKPQLGFPHGGFLLQRLGLYIGDSFKAAPNLNFIMALRYGRETGRSDSDMAPIPELSELTPGLGDRIRQPNLNFAPQLGFVWDPSRKGTTSVRGGVGLFYDDVLLTVTLFDRTLRIPIGLGNDYVELTGGTVPGTNVNISPLIGQPLGNVEAQAIAAQTAFQEFSQAATKNFNPNGLPAIIDPNGFDFNSSGGLLGPKYSTPYSTQLNLGIQQQIGKTVFVSADYEHNTNVHDILVHDLNLVGAARTLDVAAAQTAITTTNSSFGCATVSCAIAAGATITDYAANGLGSPVSGLAEQFAAPNGGFAFPGLNPNFGQMGTITTTGRSNYNAFQFRVRQDTRQPIAGVNSLNWQVSYNLSRFLAMSPDQDASLVNVADNANPTEFYGPTNLDRTHMISAAGTATFRGGLQLAWIARINTRLPVTLTQPYACDCPAEIFLTDVTGDGSGGDILPGTNIGSYGRSVSPGQLNQTISNFNANTAGTLTPAGRALVNANLLTSSELSALGATVPKLPLAPQGEVALDYFLANDLRVSWPLKPGKLLRLPESLALLPTVEIFNVVNKANFDPPTGLNTSTLRGSLDGTPGSVNGTTYLERTNRYGLGSGVFSQGIPRAVQFGLRVDF